MADVGGLELVADDITRLQHPLIGGVILFARNFSSPEQLKTLTAGIHELREPPLLIAVDHEGGRVQRFREGFTQIPPMRLLGLQWDVSRQDATHLSENVGYVMASELIAHGIDFSFAPVLDVDWGESGVIGDRAFHKEPVAIAELGSALIAGMEKAGMGAVGKHYPGHGFVRADSHHEVPIDERSFEEINQADLIPFKLLAEQGLRAVMPAHVIYPLVDSKPAGFSSKWLKEILRGEIGFDGLIFSDDLSMEGASTAGSVTQRAYAALNAGCDMVLLCNDPVLADELLQGLSADGILPGADLSRRLQSMRCNPGARSESKYQEARNTTLLLASATPT
ncbi:MAG: beta-N-acetylhexosaminidase [Burkholderiales bacterium]|nr:beta-N-acetylhexosaminidase [Burkholderiales bacterium]